MKRERDERSGSGEMAKFEQALLFVSAGAIFGLAG